MPPLLTWCLLCLCLLLVRFSLEQTEVREPRKLCGRHLLKEIVKLCGGSNWGNFERKRTPSTRLFSHVKEESFTPSQFENPQTPFMILEKDSSSAPTLSQEETISNWVMQSLSDYKHEMDNFLPDSTKIFFASQEFSPYIHKILELQKKNKNRSKIKTISHLFWGNHPQRKRRGYSEKCCLKGCTKQELRIACLPYLNYKPLKRRPSVVTEIY
ncbi:insulin-like peptide INSL6 [Sorex araneus]|uniref:insulin-like peptide INSL6 n=1 Tax=Sorex araneus TaxID=42254 RepID=UPI0001581BA5|nr:insulin-like peptide INSL6 [Sorex araneus]